MPGAANRSRVLTRCAQALALAILAGGAIFAGVGLAATAPKLTVKVTPSSVHPGENYRIIITGSYDKQAIHTVPYLVALVVYIPGTCKATIGAERALPPADWVSDFTPAKGLSEPSPGFVRTDVWTAKRFFGTRHVCAYLYPKHVPLTSTTTPLVSASTTFKDVKRR